tara:strand:- start:1685 stop:1966 length:282 start_codon:yes stop_codon:yes gene_type:complete
MYEGSNSWADWLIVTLSPEQQFMIEAGTRELQSQGPDDELTEVAVALLKQNAIQSQMIKQCVGKIAELEAKLICQENKVTQPHSKRKFFGLLP